MQFCKIYTNALVLNFVYIVSHTEGSYKNVLVKTYWCSEDEGAFITHYGK